MLYNTTGLYQTQLKDLTPGLFMSEGMSFELEWI